jgi:hypothetical protein
MRFVREETMILDETVEVKVGSNNSSYLASLGYVFDTPRTRLGIIPKVQVKVEHLQKNSNYYVNCSCDKCGSLFEQRICRNTDFCTLCKRRAHMNGNSFGKSNKGRRLPSNSGEAHPRWNPNKPEFALYRNLVYRYTRLQNIQALENSDKPRGLCGVEGAYQLDHIIPIKYGFDNGILPSILGSIQNLKIIPWEENRNKWTLIDEQTVKNVINSYFLENNNGK